jgi:hypothetical protein
MGRRVVARREAWMAPTSARHGNSNI